MTQIFASFRGYQRASRACGRMDSDWRGFRPRRGERAAVAFGVGDPPSPSLVRGGGLVGRLAAIGVARDIVCAVTP